MKKFIIAMTCVLLTVAPVSKRIRDGPPVRTES